MCLSFSSLPTCARNFKRKYMYFSFTKVTSSCPPRKCSLSSCRLFPFLFPLIPLSFFSCVSLFAIPIDFLSSRRVTRCISASKREEIQKKYMHALHERTTYKVSCFNCPETNISKHMERKNGSDKSILKDLKGDII